VQAMAEGGGTIACRGACAKLMQAAPARVPAEATNRIAGTCEGIGRITLRVASKGLAKKKRMLSRYLAETPSCLRWPANGIAWRCAKVRDAQVPGS